MIDFTIQSKQISTRSETLLTSTTNLQTQDEEASVIYFGGEE